MGWQLKNRAAGWTDWKLMLDEHGGPNGWGNFLHSTVTYHDANTFIQQPQFFHLAHFAKYVVPGSRQADLDVKCYASHEVFCQAVAFITPAGHAVVIITNDELVGIPMGSVVKGIPGVGALVNPLLSKGRASLSLGTSTVAALSFLEASHGRPYRLSSCLVVRRKLLSDRQGVLFCNSSCVRHWQTTVRQV